MSRCKGVPCTFFDGDDMCATCLTSEAERKAAIEKVAYPTHDRVMRRAARNAFLGKTITSRTNDPIRDALVALLERAERSASPEAQRQRRAQVRTYRRALTNYDNNSKKADL